MSRNFYCYAKLAWKNTTILNVFVMDIMGKKLLAGNREKILSFDEAYFYLQFIYHAHK